MTTNTSLCPRLKRVGVKAVDSGVHFTPTERKTFCVTSQRTIDYCLGCPERECFHILHARKIKL